MDGVVVENKDKQNPEEEEDQKFSAINEDYLTKIFQQTMEKYQKGAYGGINAANQLRTGTTTLDKPAGVGPISQASQIFIAENLALFKQKFLSLLKEAEVTGQIITKERI